MYQTCTNSYFACCFPHTPHPNLKQKLLAQVSKTGVQPLTPHQFTGSPHSSLEGLGGLLAALLAALPATPTGSLLFTLHSLLCSKLVLYLGARIIFQTTGRIILLSCLEPSGNFNY